MRISGEGRLGRAAKALIPAAAVVLGMTGVLAPRAAQAQFFDWGGGWGNGGWGADQGYGGIRPAQIYRELANRGFRVIAPLSRDGAVFVADVIDRRGRQERVIVSAADGQIVQRYVVGGERRMQRQAGLPGDDLQQQMERNDGYEGRPPIPPAPIPDMGGPYGRQGANSDGDPAIETFRPHPQLRILRPVKPRVVERTPDMTVVEPDGTPSQPTRLKSKPTQPLRLPSAPNTSADRPVAPPTETASRPAEPVVPRSVAPSVPVTPAAPQAANPPPASTVANPPPASKMRDPLAIPRSEPESKPVEPPKASASASTDAPRKIAPGTVTGAPPSPPPAVKPAVKTGDVPVAPLD